MKLNWLQESGFAIGDLVCIQPESPFHSQVPNTVGKITRMTDEPGWVHVQFPEHSNYYRVCPVRSWRGDTQVDLVHAKKYTFKVRRKEAHNEVEGRG